MVRRRGAGELAQAAALKTILALPGAVRRRLTSPQVRQGQWLANDLRLMLGLSRLAGEPQLGDLDVPGTRVALDRQAAAAGGRRRVASVRDLVLGEGPDDPGGLRARLYVPRARLLEQRAPMLVFFHGGGFVSGDLESHDGPCRFLAEEAGVRVLSVEYRLAPEHPFPAAHDDAWTAYRWVLEHPDLVGADVDRLAVGGDSAGANLATHVARRAAQEGTPLAFQLLAYPVTDATRTGGSRDTYAEGYLLTRRFIEQVTDHYTPDPATRTDPRISPLLADEVPAGMAPAHVATAGWDPLRDEGEDLGFVLQRAGVRAEVRRHPSQIHGFLNFVGVAPTSRLATRELASALRVALG
ncbi:alpha/beta hydrolase [Nocardioides sp. CFH 31398]|uniref:alpha/beta hydrolase n=1 Tax=Nocardioides sp. CFH 31398 TaxID=2919579 RepID=UPI001F05C10F|nr:alpha/beta hydrolase [Nocardioides sp. CFH 31398]MCH1866030.1 alpha/beta hydrolase [Nocardioides sp. CFH 31398]